MEEMHYFKESQREEIPVPDFKDNITRKLPAAISVRPLHLGAGYAGHQRLELKMMRIALYILFRNFAFSEQDFWQTFGGYLIALRPKWKIGIFGTELSSQETAALLLDQPKREILCGSKNDFRPLCGQYPFSLPAN